MLDNARRLKIDSFIFFWLGNNYTRTKIIKMKATIHQQSMIAIQSANIDYLHKYIGHQKLLLIIWRQLLWLNNTTFIKQTWVSSGIETISKITVFFITWISVKQKNFKYKCLKPLLLVCVKPMFHHETLLSINL